MQDAVFIAVEQMAAMGAGAISAACAVANSFSEAADQDHETEARALLVQTARKYLGAAEGGAREVARAGDIGMYGVSGKELLTRKDAVSFTNDICHRTTMDRSVLIRVPILIQ